MSIRKVYEWVKMGVYGPLMVPALTAYAVKRRDARLQADLRRFGKYEFGDERATVGIFYRLMVLCPVFRNVFYYRCGHASVIIAPFMKGVKSLTIRYIPIGGGIFIRHGFSTRISAERIGENFWVHQNVTIGYGNNGRPTIGNNVQIGTGAVVLGGITIGDNVNIGANATVLRDVPGNTTVVGPMARIVRREGEKVDEAL